MTHTTSSTVMSFALIGGVLAWALQGVLSTFGYSAFVPPWSWGFGLGILGVLVIVMAWPIRQRLGARAAPGLLDPFYATRVVLLAKSSTLVGALLTGVAMGAGVFFLMRPVVIESSLWATGGAWLGAILLMVAGILAERWCTLPPGSSDGLAPEVTEGEPG